MMNSDGTSASTLKELNQELLEEMDNFIDTLPTELPEHGHHDEFVFICLYRYARDLAVDLTLLIEATTIAADTFNSPGMHILCRPLLITCIDTYYIKVDPLERAKRYMDYNVLVALPNVNDSEEEQERNKNQFIQSYSETVNGSVKKPSIMDWSGISTEKKIKEGIQLFFSEENQPIISDSISRFYKITCNHVHGNFTIGMYTTWEPETEEQLRAKKERELSIIGTCMFLCNSLIMQNLYKLYRENTESLDKICKRFYSLLD